MKSKSQGFKKTLQTIDLIRKVIVNAIFIILLIIMLLFWGFVFFTGKSSSPINIVSSNSTLVLDFNGSVIERSSLTGLDKVLMGDDTNEYRVFDILKVISAAKEDNKIKQILIKTDGLRSVGWAQAHEIANALNDFKKSGKKIVAHGENLNQKQYLIASVADKIYLDKMGSVIIEGLSSYRQYYREALEDKLGIDMHLFKVGEFKSAAEPYVMDYASSESKEADMYWMEGIWNRYLQSISTARDIPLDEFKESIFNFKNLVEEYEGDLAMVAMHQGLIDGFATYDQVQSMMSDNKDDLVKSSYSSYLSYVDANTVKNKNKIGIIVLEGEIVSGKSNQNQAGDESIYEMIKRVKDDPYIKAVVFRVNSPGGSVIASEKIRRGIESLKEEGKIVVVSMGDMGASGGYWVSMNADYIMADHSTITGSIGIFGLVPNFSRGLEKIGVYTDGVATSPLANAFSPTIPMQEDTSKIIENIIKHGYDDFIEKVSIARGMSVGEVNEVSKGRVWTGSQAKERGLVDELGGLNNAIVHTRELLHLSPKEVEVVMVGNKISSLEKFFFGANISIEKIFNKKLSSLIFESYIPHENKSDVDFMLNTIKEASKPGVGIKTYAHCLCEI